MEEMQVKNEPQAACDPPEILAAYRRGQRDMWERCRWEILGEIDRLEDYWRHDDYEESDGLKLAAKAIQKVGERENVVPPPPFAATEDGQ